MRKRIIAVAIFVVLPVIASALEVTPPDSPWKLDIYGVILSNTYWNSSGVVGSDVPLWAVSGADARAEDSEFSLTARQSRFGFRLKAPDAAGAKLSGLLEVDFFGGFPASGQSPSFANPRLRLAWMKLQWERATFTAGQDWIILAPLNPVTIAHFAVVGLAASGNLWLRYPQLRVDMAREFASGKWTFTGGIIRPVSGSDPAPGGTLTDIAGAGERSGLPFWQGRIGYSRTVSEKMLGLGLSAHYGREEYRLAAGRQEIDSWAVAADISVPVGRHVVVQGEIFSGSNLDSFQGGINQGFRLFGSQFSDATSIEPLDATGGWIQLSFTPPQNENVSMHVTYGIDNPDETLLVAGQRLQNSTWMVSVFYRFSKHFQTAFEYNRIETDYAGIEGNEASVVNGAFSFTF